MKVVRIGAAYNPSEGVVAVGRVCNFGGGWLLGNASTKPVWNYRPGVTDNLLEPVFHENS